MSKPFAGIFTPVTTPFSADESIRYDWLEANLKSYLQRPVDGFLLLGSNGESGHLTSDEKIQVVQVAIDAISGQRPVIVGVSHAALRDSLRFLDSLRDLAVDAILAGVPSYFKNRMTSEALLRYFTSVADHSPFPVLLYNVPQYSGLRLEAALVGELAAHPNIVGLKDSSGDLIYLQDVLQRAGPDFETMVGSAQILGPALALGIEGAILAVACALPELPSRLVLEHSEGRPIARTQAELYRVAMALTSRYGVAGVKQAMDLTGLKGGICRLPLLPLNAEEAKDIETILRASRVAHELLDQVLH